MQASAVLVDSQFEAVRARNVVLGNVGRMKGKLEGDAEAT